MTQQRDLLKSKMKEALLIQKNPPIGESDSDSNFRVLFNLKVIKRNVLATESNSKEKN